MPTFATFLARVAAVAAIALLAGVEARADPSAGAASFHVELNRLEDHAGGCRVNLVIENASTHAYTSYRMDLVIFSTDGIIARRVALEAAPLRARKTMVKEFELENLACARIGRVLLNDITACASDAGETGDCVAATRTSSRARAAFVK